MTEDKTFKPEGINLNLDVKICFGPVPSPYSAIARARVNSEIAFAAAMSRSRAHPSLARSQTHRAHDATDTSSKLTCLLTRARLPQP